MRAPRSVVYGCLALALAAGGAAAAERVQYYDVAGRSANDLRKAMDRMRPTAPDGRRRDALTLWNITWRYGTFSQPGAGCSLQSFEVTLDISITLPRWIDQEKGRRALADKWQIYQMALQRHEEGHRTLATAAAEAVKDAMKNVQPQADCGALATVVNGLASATIEGFRTREREYDLQTNHGEKQGAKFP